jgi:hypothetical protein
MLAAMLAPAQDAGRVIGEVTAVDAAGGQLTLKTDAGAPVTVQLTDSTLYLRVPPGEKDLKKAAKVTLADIAVGDRVLARGAPATAVIIMTKSDLARKHAAESAEWQRRGIAGTILALNPTTREITVQVGPKAAGRTVSLEPAGDAVYRRYAPDSVRFADAKPSGFGELQVGDQVRGLGDASPDGTRFKAEQVISGAFRTLAGQVKSVDAAAGEIRVTDLATKKPVLVRANPDTTLRRMPPEMAAGMARFRERQAAGGPPPAPPADGAGMRRPGGMDFQRMLDRMPALNLSELKPGDALVISSTKGVDPSQVTAIAIVAGVEPLLTAAPNGGRQIGEGWTFDIAMPGLDR